MNDPAIGTREYGKFARRSRWYICDTCGRNVPEDETAIPDPPHPQAGKRVCTRYCLDDPDYQMNTALAPPSPSTTENLP